MTCFQDTAEFILGQNAAFLGELKEKVSQLAYCIFTVCLEVELCFTHLVLGCPQISWGFFWVFFFDPSGKEIFFNALKAGLAKM